MSYKEDRMLGYFEYDHLPVYLQTVSKEFSQLAHRIALHLDESPERTVSLRKLLEAKDAAVRAAVDQERTRNPR